jgi:hypothetical protein
MDGCVDQSCRLVAKVLGQRSWEEKASEWLCIGFAKRSILSRVRPDFAPTLHFSSWSLRLSRDTCFTGADNMRKQLDPRIPILINNNVKQNHRSFIVLVGDKGRDQVRLCSLLYWTWAEQLRLSTCTSSSRKREYLHVHLYYGATRKSWGSPGEPTVCSF